MSASVNLPMHHKGQKFSSGTGSPSWSRKKGRKTVVVVVVHTIPCHMVNHTLDSPVAESSSSSESSNSSVPCCNCEDLVSPAAKTFNNWHSCNQFTQLGKVIQNSFPSHCSHADHHQFMQPERTGVPTYLPGFISTHCCYLWRDG